MSACSLAVYPDTNSSVSILLLSGHITPVRSVELGGAIEEQPDTIIIRGCFQSRDGSWYNLSLAPDRVSLGTRTIDPSSDVAPHVRKKLAHLVALWPSTVSKRPI
jgi:hypothetical protein